MEVGLVVEVAVCFSENSSSIHLKTIMQRLAVLGYIKLLQRAALIYYYSVPLKLAPVEVVMHSVVLHLFLVIDDHFTMHIWSFL